MDSGGFNWGLITIIAPLLMVVVIGWAVMKNRKSKIPMERTEEGTRELYRQEDAAHRNDDTMGT